MAEVTAVFPVGVILPWYSKGGPLPAGWRICDGTEGTPDLRERFVRGVSDYADVGRIGGETRHHHEFSARTNSARDRADGWNADGMTRGRSPETTGTDHTHAVEGNTTLSTHLPPYIDVLFIMYIGG